MNWTGEVPGTRTPLINDLLSKETKKSLKKDPRLLSPEKKAAALKELEEAVVALDALDARNRAENPFWYYAPVSGEIVGERRAFLREFLKDEDIPQKLHGAIDVHLSTASIRGASGGNQSSKTTTGCIEALIKATGSLPFCFDPTHKDFKFAYPAHRLERKGPQFVRVIGEDYQNGVLRNLIPTYRKWAPREHLIDGSWEKSYSSGEQTLRLIDPHTKALRGTIEFMSNKQDLGTFQGPPRHMLVFDEEPDHEVYKENLMRFTTASSLDVLFCMTPTKGLSWTYDLFTRGTDETGNNVDWFQIASVCNPHANIKVLREILKEMESYEELKMRLLGEFVSLSGLVYGKLFQHSLHVIRPFETGCTCGGSKEHTDSCPHSKYMGFLGIDPHMVKDSCAVMCFVDREDNFFVDTCYKRGVTVEEMKRDLTLLSQGHRIVKRVVDPSSDSSLTIHDNVNIFQLLKRGKFALPNLTKADKFQGSISAGISNIKERLKVLERSKQPRFFIFDRPENKLLIKSFKTLQRETFADEEQKGRKDKIAEGLHDHHACVRYILQRRFSWRPAMIDTPDFGVPDEEMLVA